MLVHLYKKEKMIYGFIYFFKFYKEILIKIIMKSYLLFILHKILLFIFMIKKIIYEHNGIINLK